jgi:hypothetical protein
MMKQRFTCEVLTEGPATMKLPGALAALLITVGVCLAPYAAEAAGKYDDAAPFVCVPTAVAECVSDGECRPGTAESENLPDFFKIDLKAKTVRAEDKGKQSPIERVEREGDEVTLYGSEAGRAWVLMIREKTGRMSASVTGDGESFVIFGVCPPP